VPDSSKSDEIGLGQDLPVCFALEVEVDGGRDSAISRASGFSNLPGSKGQRPPAHQGRIASDWSYADTYLAITPWRGRFARLFHSTQ
jgi:hypothetical protein